MDIFGQHLLSPREKKRSIFRIGGLVVFFILVGTALFFGQCTIEDNLQSGNISEELVNNYIKFNTSAMTTQGAFFSSYIHKTDNNRSHLNGNLLNYSVYSIIIIFIASFLECMKSSLPSYYFTWVMGILFIVFPFIFALVFEMYDHFWHQHVGVVCCGFSGVVFALLGISVGLIAYYVEDVVKTCNIFVNIITMLIRILIIIVGIFLGIFLAIPAGLLSGGIPPCIVWGSLVDL